MLSDTTKRALSHYVDLIRRSGRLEYAQKIGPAKIYDSVLDENSSNGHIDQDIISNRKEAEQYLGGLLGMC